MNENYSMEKVSNKAALVETSSAREVAEIQSMMVIAKRFPRNQKEALERIKTACMRPGLAGKAIYQYARGGTDIEGASIRLAEAIAQNWGNVQYGIRELEQRNGESTVEAFCWDTETNTRSIKIFQVPHLRYTRQGTKRLEDPRDIYEMVANQGARRLRACILAVIPVDVVEDALIQCDETMRADVSTTPEAIANMLKAFDSFKVTKAMIEQRIQRSIESITPALMINLLKIYNSIKDGMSQASEWFELPQNEIKEDTTKSKTEQLVKDLKGKKTTPKPSETDELPEGAGLPL